MRILFLSDNFPPEVNAPASRTYEHCREWVLAGHEVTVITCAPNFPTGKLFQGYKNAWYQSETMDGIKVVRVWSFITANEGFFKRLLDYLSFMFSAILAAQAHRRADVIVATSPQFFTSVAGFVVSWTHWKPWVFELRDIWPESIRAVGAMKTSVALDALEWLELFLYRRAAAVISVTNAFKANLVKRGIDASKIGVVTNGADLTRFSPMPRDAELTAKYGLDGKLVAGYVGTHGMAHGLETLLEAAAALKRAGNPHRIHLIFLGDGASKKDLVAKAQMMSLDNVTFIDSVPKDQVARYWSLLDVSIIHLKADPLFETVIPSKLFECMAMGLPVLHGVKGESAGIVQKEEAGLVFEPGDPAALTSALERLAADPALRRSISDKARIAAANYDRRALAATMLHMLESVAKTGALPTSSGNTRP